MDITSYYDKLASYYRWIYTDWEASVERQAGQLDTIIRESMASTAESILDVSCGIGTQSLGLARRGYRVSASTISKFEIEEARATAKQWGLEIDFKVGDMRNVYRLHPGPFDVVISCDNAVPHLLTDQDIELAFREFYRCLRPGGLCIISVRDYSDMPKSGQQLLPRHVHQVPDGRIVMFDVRDFEENHYEYATYLTHDKGEDSAETIIMRGRYYCVGTETLSRLLETVGFESISVHSDRFFQPMIIATKPDRDTSSTSS